MFPIVPAMCCGLASLLGDKLTQCLKSGPTDRPKRLRFASLPTGTGRGRRSSAQLHLAPLWSLQNLAIIKKKKQPLQGGGLSYFSVLKQTVTYRPVLNWNNSININKKKHTHSHVKKILQHSNVRS